jgi:hemoglobin
MKMRFLAPCLLLLVMGCAGAKAVPQKSLYQRLGGLHGISAVVNKSVDRISADKRVNEFFANFDISVIRQHFIQLLCVASGGPCKYEGRSMEESHKGLHITNSAFDAVLEDIGFTMKKLKVGDEEQDEVIQLLNSMRKEIVEVR